MPTGANHNRLTAQVIQPIVTTSDKPPNGDPPHFFTTSPHTRTPNTKESAVPTIWSVTSIVHCITGTICAPPGHTSTQPPPNGSLEPRTRPCKTNTYDTTCPHSVCSDTLIITRVTCAPNVTGASWQGIPCHDGPSMRTRRPLLIGNIPTDGATPLRAAAKL